MRAGDSRAGGTRIRDNQDPEASITRPVADSHSHRPIVEATARVRILTPASTNTALIHGSHGLRLPVTDKSPATITASRPAPTQGLPGT